METASAQRKPKPLDYSRECGMYRYEIDNEIREMRSIGGAEVDPDMSVVDTAFADYMDREYSGVAVEEIF